MTASDHSELLRRHRQPEPVMVTRPAMPPREDYERMLAGIWQRRWLTNEGVLHQELEKKVREYLGVANLNLFCNGAIALLVALQAMRINDGEVITTPFTFPATTHVLYWNRLRPVFCDIEPNTFNIDPAKIERLITPQTRAILAVHVYGNPCDIDALQRIANRHGVSVIYDAAHAFGVTQDGKSVLSAGDLSMLSFHATKVFSTIEGGALVSPSKEIHSRINSLKNFGIASEESIVGPGINGKMNEFQAAFGLLALDTVDAHIAERKGIAEQYRSELSGVPGIRVLHDIPGVRHNYGYFPIIVDGAIYGLDRDNLHARLKDFNFVTRKYFYPLVSDAPCYAGLPTATVQQLPIAHDIARRVLCLPIYPDLSRQTVAALCSVIRELAASTT